MSAAPSPRDFAEAELLNAQLNILRAVGCEACATINDFQDIITGYAALDQGSAADVLIGVAAAVLITAKLTQADTSSDEDFLASTDDMLQKLKPLCFAIADGIRQLDLLSEKETATSH